MSLNDLQRVTHAVITSRLDSCNAVFTCLGQNMPAWLQRVQNAAGRIFTTSRKHDHVQPFLASLPVCFRTDFLNLTLSF